MEILNKKPVNDQNVQFVPRPSKRRTSSAANLTLFYNSLAVQGLNCEMGEMVELVEMVQPVSTISTKFQPFQPMINPGGGDLN